MASAPNRLWVSDLTYIWTQQGWQYPCVFLDVYSRKVVGYSIDDSMEAAMVNDVLKMGDCWDNAVAESFFATIKGELIDQQHWISKVQARLAIVEWIECFYNNQRRLSSIGSVCPVEYESLTRAMQAA